MKIVEIPIDQLKGAPWNSNAMEEAMLDRLKESIRRYGLVQNLVVRPTGSDCFEVLSGNQRLRVLKETGFTHASCVVVELDDTGAKLLAQALNRIRGEDDLGLRADLLRQIREVIPGAEILRLLPETSGSLKGLAAMGAETVATHLQNWQKAQAAKLKHMQFQLTAKQLEVVEKALKQFLPAARVEQQGSPNTRGTALYLLCEYYLKEK